MMHGHEKSDLAIVAGKLANKAEQSAAELVERFVVIDERYHPNWLVRADAEEIPIFPTNAVMMGIRIPANLDHIHLHFMPFSSTWPARMLMLLALLIFLAAIATLWFGQRRVGRYTPSATANRQTPIAAG
jgi:uncharacterized membrane protein YfhO